MSGQHQTLAALPWYPLNTRLGQHQAGVEDFGVEEISCLCRTLNPTVQPVASR